LQINVVWWKKISNRLFRNGERMKTFQRLTLTAILAASALLATGCSGNGSQAVPAPSTTDSAASATVTATTAPKANAVPAVALPAGIIAKGVANDGKGDYLQTSISDSDPAMQYNPAIADDGAKAHYSAADLAEAQKVAVKFIAEEAIDSTLNGGSGDIASWWASHKNEIHPLNQDIMLTDMKNDKGDKAVIDTEAWMASKPGYSYVHGATTTRVKTRTITPTALRFVQSGTLEGVMLDTKASWTMEVTGGTHTGVQSTTAELSFAVAKDPADGKWKIAGYNTNYHTAEG
jgi:hypothetical protein